MKKTLFLPLVMCLLLVGSSLSAQVIDKPVATIKLIKTEAITVKQFQKAVESLQMLSQKPFTREEKKKILDEMINEKLIVQAAQRDGMTVTTAEIKAKIAEARGTVERQVGRKITDAEFDQLIQSQGLTMDKLEETIENQLIAQKYLQLKQQKYASQVKRPSAEEVVKFYEENIKEFNIPEMVRIKQIVVYAKDLPPALDSTYKARMEEIHKELIKGASFDDYWKVYLTGATEAIGELNMDVWQKTDKKKAVTYGEPFFNSVFDLKKGSLSKVLKSNIGYHIVQILESIPAKKLSLDEKVPPKYTVTAREQIEKALMTKSQLELTQQALQEITDEIKKTAVIKIFDENLDG